MSSEGQHSRASTSELEDCVWPDPAPGSIAEGGGCRSAAEGGGCLVNDVSRMSDFGGTSIDRIFFPRDEADVAGRAALIPRRASRALRLVFLDARRGRRGLLDARPNA